MKLKIILFFKQYIQYTVKQGVQKNCQVVHDIEHYDFVKVMCDILGGCLLKQKNKPKFLAYM